MVSALITHIELAKQSQLVAYNRGVRVRVALFSYRDCVFARLDLEEEDGPDRTVDGWHVYARRQHQPIDDRAHQPVPTLPAVEQGICGAGMCHLHVAIEGEQCARRTIRIPHRYKQLG